MLKTLAAHIKEYKKPSIATPIFMILEVMMEMMIPYLFASLIDDGVQKGNMKHILAIGGIMVVIAGVGLFAGVMGGIYGAKASTGFAKNLRKGMFDNIQTFAFSNIDKFSTAGLVTRLTTDVTNVQNSYQMILRMCMRAPVSLVLAMVMSFVISAKMASIYVVKAYVRENHEKDKFQAASNGIYNMFVKAEKTVAYNSPVMQITVYTCILLISWFGAKLIVGSNNTELTTGELTSLLSYCMTILMNLMMVSMIFVMMSMSVASAERIAEVLDEKADLVNPKNPCYEVADGSIVFNHVDFGYHAGDEKRVLTDINLEIRPGETIGIIGGTGSSKSSLVNLISRLYDVTGGSVLVGGKDVRDYDIETLRNEVSVVLKKNVLFSGTILENLRWGDKDATEEECVRACKLACADEFIGKLPDGYNTYIEQGGSNVSGGQKQRLCIARALLKKPKILILDDSTSAVDTATDAKIRHAFATEIPKTTKLIIAQRISSIQHADRILVLDDGKIDGIGTHEELLGGNEIYRDVYESQTGGSGDFDENGGEA